MYVFDPSLSKLGSEKNMRRSNEHPVRDRRCLLRTSNSKLEGKLTYYKNNRENEPVISFKIYVNDD